METFYIIVSVFCLLWLAQQVKIARQDKEKPELTPRTILSEAANIVRNHNRKTVESLLGL